MPFAGRMLLEGCGSREQEQDGKFACIDRKLEIASGGDNASREDRELGEDC